MGECEGGLGHQVRLTGEQSCCCPRGGWEDADTVAFHRVLFIFQEIKLRFFLPVNFLNKDILKSWKTCLSYFNCVKTGCAGGERGRGKRERGGRSGGERGEKSGER